MSEEEFLVFADQFIAAHKPRYGLARWRVNVRVVDQDRPIAEVAVNEQYRSATVYVARRILDQAPQDLLENILKHELEHVFFHPLEALRELCLDAVPEAMRKLVNNEFMRAGERLRSDLELLLTQEQHPAKVPGAGFTSSCADSCAEGLAA